MFSRTEVDAALGVFRARWKLYLAIHVWANALYFLVLAPTATLLIGWLILLSGDVALTDEDIARFVLSPRGFIAAVFAVAVLLTTLILEQAALFVAGHRVLHGKEVGIRRLGLYLLERLSDLFSLALRMVARVALVAAPFLAVAYVIYTRYLTEFDINYYLAAHPPVLWWAGGGIALSLLVMAMVLFRVMAGWIAALPLLLLERGSPGSVLAMSRSVSRSLWRHVAWFLGLWLLANGALLGVVSGLLDLGVTAVTLVAGNSLQALAYLMGGLLLLWVLGYLAVTYLGTCALSLGMLFLFRKLVPDAIGDRLEVRLEPKAEGTAWRISGGAVMGMLAILAVATGFALAVTFDDFEVRDRAEIVAHRGASAAAPENTLAAMEEAIRQGADWLEIDVQETAEGEIVVIHDRDLKKVGGVPLRVWGTPLGQLQAVDIGSWRDPRFDDQRVPTLGALLRQVRGRAGVIIELKYYGNEQRFEERVAEIVERASMQDDIKLMSLHLEGARRMKALRPDWEVGLLSSVAVGDITRLDLDFFAVNARYASRNFIRRAHRRGREVLTWTVNDAALMSALMSKNVDGIITDKPGLAQQVRAERQELELHELVMIHLAALLGGKVAQQ